MSAGSRPVVIVMGSARPHEVLLLAYSAFAGPTYLFGAPKPGSLEAYMPHWEVLLWATFLGVSGITGLFGCFWRRSREVGMAVELGAMLLGAAATSIYAVAVFTVGGWRTLLAGGVITAWTCANLVRAAQIRRDLRAIDIEGGG